MILLSLAPASGSAAPAQAPTAPEALSEHIRYELVRYSDRIESDGTTTSSQEIRVLLRTPSAVRRYGQIGWYYTEGYGGVEFESVVVEKPDGRRLDVKDGHVEDVNPYSDFRYKTLTIAGLEAGDLLSYKIVAHRRPLTPGRVFGELKLTPMAGDPVQVYELDIPRDAEIRVRLRDGLSSSWEEIPGPADRLARRLSLEVALPDMDQEDWTEAAFSSWMEPDVMYTSFSTWKEVGHWWFDLAQPQFAVVEPVATQAEVLASEATSARAKLEALHEYAASQIRYEDVGFGIGRMRPRPAGEVLTSRYGDCKDKHGLLAALATSIGLDVRPVLINTAVSDLRDDVPAPQQFNHVISVALLGPDPEDWLWFDATNPYGLPGYLGPNIRDKRALLIGPSGEGRIVRTPAEPPFVPTVEVRVEGKLEADGILRARVIWEMRTDSEVYLRSAFAATEPERHVDFMRRGPAKDWSDAKITDVSISDPSDLDAPFRMEFHAETVAVTGRAPDLQSLAIPLPEVEVPEPVSGEVELKESLYSVRAEIELAEGLSARAPLSVSMDRPFGQFEAEYSADGSHIALSRRLRTSRGSISSDDLSSYEAFRTAMEADELQLFSIVGELGDAAEMTAQELYEKGTSAFTERRYKEAAELLEEAASADSSLKNVYLELGRALFSAGKKAEALAAFSRQTELDPYHQHAYAWKAHTLTGVGRRDEAEQYLLKQIEVAPFQAWSYEQMGHRRGGENNYPDAAHFYKQAAAIEPRKLQHWVDLGWAEAWSGRVAQARAAADIARALELPFYPLLRVGALYEFIGEPAIGGELGEQALDGITGMLAKLLEKEPQQHDLQWNWNLGEGWFLVGAAAYAAGDDDRAERYLTAAWTLTEPPRAAWLLGELRERQGRHAEAIDLWRLASLEDEDAIGDTGHRKRMLPKDLDGRISEVQQKLQDTEIKDDDELRRQLEKSREVRLEGNAELNAAVLLLVGVDGRVEATRNLSKMAPAEFNRQLAQFERFRVPFTAPDDRPYKMVRLGRIKCPLLTPCVLELTPGNVTHMVEPEQYGAAADRWAAFKLAKPSETNPFAGIWKLENCSPGWSLAIAALGEGTYYVAACGPIGCMEPGPVRRGTTIKGDPNYRVLDNDTIEVKSGDAFHKYVRCTGASTDAGDEAQAQAKAP